MAVSLPRLTEQELAERLSQFLDFGLSADVVQRLWAHYEELRRWSPRLSLIGRGTANEVVARHYAESLVALPLLGSPSRVVDLGSGAGFPGLILAAARPDLDVWLVESRQRKATFLSTAARKASLSCTVLSARVGASLPDGFPQAFDLMTIRALRLGSGEWAALGDRLAEKGRIIRWVGPTADPPPVGFVVARCEHISGSQRAVEELVRTVQEGREE